MAGNGYMPPKKEKKKEAKVTPKSAKAKKK